MRKKSKRGGTKRGAAAATTKATRKGRKTKKATSVTKAATRRAVGGSSSLAVSPALRAELAARAKAAGVGSWKTFARTELERASRAS